ncbi:hypothetical protein AK812_SmicGene10327 [Symbiodinium microadriaticum]|uniref:Uncharacterized protein n=1 Tax=Symbiodinium microadriaticum TaxID=2951 RepID=A0A1Q9EG06_SYMMI|nr:hypothetical protein AK812_SmicGene10327 [Symbiodinium microadriaticum]
MGRQFDKRNDDDTPLAVIEGVRRLPHREFVSDAPATAGCGLAPVLWAVYSGSNTTYADDFIFNWVIDSGQALECIQAGETGSPLSGSQRSPDQHDQDSHSAGSPGQAQNALAKYLVTLQDGTYMRFQVQDRKVDLRVVHSHVYLGAQIGYRKFEQADHTVPSGALPVAASALEDLLAEAQRINAELAARNAGRLVHHPPPNGGFAEVEGLMPDAAAFAARHGLDIKVQQDHSVVRQLFELTPSALAFLDAEAQCIAIGLVDLQAKAAWVNVAPESKSEILETAGWPKEGYAGGVTDTGALVLGFKVSPVHSGSDVNLTSYYIESPGLEPTLCGCATSQLDSSWPDELMPVLEAGVSADELLHAVNTIQRHSPVNHEAVTMAFGVGFNPGCAPDDGGGLPPSSVAALRIQNSDAVKIESGLDAQAEDIIRAYRPLPFENTNQSQEPAPFSRMDLDERCSAELRMLPPELQDQILKESLFDELQWLKKNVGPQLDGDDQLNHLFGHGPCVASCFAIPPNPRNPSAAVWSKDASMVNSTLSLMVGGSGVARRWYTEVQAPEVPGAHAHRIAA